MRAVILLMNEYLASSLSSGGALDEILADNETHLVYAFNPSDAPSISGARGIHRIPWTNDTAHELLLAALMWRFRAKSGAFRLRFQRIALGNARIRSITAAIRALPGLFVSRHVPYPPIAIPILGSRLIFPIACWLLKMRITESREFRLLLKKLNPDIVIIPSASNEALAFDAISACRRHGAVSLLVAENWDNLSSKTILWERPDHVAVWGRQAAEHARDIQGIDPSRIHLLGSPRRLPTRVDPSRTRSKRRVLFLGCAIPHLEVEVVRRLAADLTVESSDWSVLYRPHPFRQRRSRPDDPQALVGVDGIVVDFRPFDGTSSAIRAAFDESALAVGPLTTALLEAAVAGLPVIALVDDDEVHRTTAARALTRYPHLNDLPRLTGLQTCRDIGALAALVRETADGVNPRSRAEDGLSISYFIHEDSRTYGRRLSDLAEEVVALRREG